MFIKQKLLVPLSNLKSVPFEELLFWLPIPTLPILIDCYPLTFRNSLSFFKISGKWESLLGFLCFIYETMFIIHIEGIHADTCSLNRCLRIVHGDYSCLSGQ